MRGRISEVGDKYWMEFSAFVTWKYSLTSSVSISTQRTVAACSWASLLVSVQLRAALYYLEHGRSHARRRQPVDGWKVERHFHQGLRQGRRRRRSGHRRSLQVGRSSLTSSCVLIHTYVEVERKPGVKGPMTLPSLVQRYSTIQYNLYGAALRNVQERREKLRIKHD